LVALPAFISFLARGAPAAYTVLAGMETVITVLFLLLYLLRLDTRMRYLYWPLADIINSVIAALFLCVAFFVLLIRMDKGTLAGGVFAIILLALCLLDVVLLCKKISADKARGRSAPAE
ncbi:CKLF factor, partial [Erythrocercus mccallii]|nr:CKLF factor [Erythrocercus mccallii]